MRMRYDAWAMLLAGCLELGILCLFFLDVIGMTTTITGGFAVGAVLIAAWMLHRIVPEDDQPREDRGSGMR